MNFNYDLTTWINYFIGSFACCFGLFLSGNIITYRKLKDFKWYKYLIIILFSILMIINSFVFENVARIFGMLLILYSMFKFFYKENNNYIITISVISYIICIISEVTYYIINVLTLDIVLETVKSIGANIIIAIISIIYSYILRKKITPFINKLKRANIKFVIFLSILIILVVFSSMYSLYLNKWNMDYKFVLNIIIILGCLILLLVLIRQHFENKEITDKYVLLNEYLKTSADLIEKYSSTVHKYKNNLIAIKGYLKKDMKEAEDYIDNLLGDYNSKKYSWFNKINYIKIDAIRYLIYYKLSKAETENLKISVDVSNDIKDISNDLITLKESNTLLEIIGEYFDNAIYASSESHEKELNFMMYKEDDNLIFVLANTYKGEVDLTSITKNGYTTKGKGHGLGLYDIEKSIRKNPWIKTKYELMDNYFVTTLTINKKANKE